MGTNETLVQPRNMNLHLASGNQHKLSELRAYLGDSIVLRGLADLGMHEEIPETADTLEGNAFLKARYLYDRLEADTIAEDTGLEVVALDMAPGVYSARFAGNQKDPSANVKKLLEALEGKSDRRARFRTVIALMIDGAMYTFEGEVWGTISVHPEGTGGFGYDPVFIPDGWTESFASLPEQTKLAMSHRSRAIEKCVAFLEKYITRKSPQSAGLQK